MPLSEPKGHASATYVSIADQLAQSQVGFATSVSGPAPLNDDLQQLLKDHGEFLGLSLTYVGTVRGTHSITSQFGDDSDGENSAIVIKYITSSTPEKVAQSVTREYEALQTVWNVADDDFRSTLPQPMMMIPERGLLVSGKLPGIALSRILRRSLNYFAAPFRTREMCAIARSVGEWLRKFHWMTEGCSRPYDARAFERELMRQLESCVRRGLKRETAEELLRIANEGSRRAAGKCLGVAARHGDFTPRNVLTDGRQVGVVDFENFVREDFIYEDVAKFLAFLSLLKGRLFYSRRAVDAVMRSFLQGYGATGRDSILELFQLKAEVRIFAHHGETGLASAMGLDHLYFRQFLSDAQSYAQTLGLRLAA